MADEDKGGAKPNEFHETTRSSLWLITVHSICEVWPYNNLLLGYNLKAGKEAAANAPRIQWSGYKSMEP